jgi:AcrR family transcriptional regulator
LEFTISELEERTGVPRTTIHYYIREGLLPPAWKSSATRGTYRQHHVDRLRLISRMKAEGLSLEAIEGALIHEPEFPSPGPDYGSERDDHVRRRILEAAARRFSSNGYDGTRIADVIKDVGIGKQVFLSHFPTKRALFVASFEVLSESWIARVEPRIRIVSGFVLRQLLRTDAFISPRDASPLRLQLLRAEGWKLGDEAQRVVDKTFRTMIEEVRQELDALRSEGTPAGLSAELLSLGMMDFATSVLMHTQGDDPTSRLDAMRALLCIYSAVYAIWTGQFDVREPLREYEELLRRMALSPGSVLASIGDAPPTQVASLQGG